MAKGPSYNIAIALEITLPPGAIPNAGHDIARQAGLFRNDQNHLLSPFQKSKLMIPQFLRNCNDPGQYLNFFHSYDKIKISYKRRIVAHVPMDQKSHYGMFQSTD